MPQSSVDPVVAGNVRLALQRSGRSPKDIALALGHAPNWLYRVIREETGILLPGLRQLAMELGVPVGALVEDNPDSDKAWGEIHVSIPEYKTQPVFGVRRSGDGIVGWEPVRKDWFDRLEINPSNCEVVRVHGTFMELIPQQEHAVLVDRSLPGPQDGHIYLLQTSEGLVVKRVVRHEGFGRWAVVTDSPEWARQCWPLTKDMAILGEVLGALSLFLTPES